MDAVPRHIKDMAIDWLADNDLPFEWEDAVAREFAAAIEDRKIEFVRTHEQGRPYDTPLVEWEHRELDPHSAYERAQQAGQALGYTGCHDDCVPLDDVRGVAQQ